MESDAAYALSSWHGLWGRGRTQLTGPWSLRPQQGALPGAQAGPLAAVTVRKTSPVGCNGWLQLMAGEILSLSTGLLG